jgi:hypothetical protein
MVSVTRSVRPRATARAARRRRTCTVVVRPVRIVRVVAAIV